MKGTIWPDEITLSNTCSCLGWEKPPLNKVSEKAICYHVTSLI